jgi:hypothetical protein
LLALFQNQKKRFMLNAMKHLYRFVASALITAPRKMLHCVQHDYFPPIIILANHRTSSTQPFTTVGQSGTRSR